MKALDDVFSLCVTKGRWDEHLTANMWLTAQGRHSAEQTAIFEQLNTVINAEVDLAVDVFTQKEVKLGGGKARWIFGHSADTRPASYPSSYGRIHRCYLPRFRQMCYLLEAAFLPAEMRSDENPYANDLHSLVPRLIQWMHAQVAAGASIDTVRAALSANELSAVRASGAYGQLLVDDAAGLASSASSSSASAAAGAGAGAGAKPSNAHADVDVEVVSVVGLVRSEVMHLPSWYEGGLDLTPPHKPFDDMPPPESCKTTRRELLASKDALFRPYCIPYVGLDTAESSVLMRMLKEMGDALCAFQPKGSNNGFNRPGTACLEVFTLKLYLSLTTKLYRAAPCPLPSSVSLPSLPDDFRHPASPPMSSKPARPNDALLSPSARAILNHLVIFSSNVGIVFTAHRNFPKDNAHGNVDPLAYEEFELAAAQWHYGRVLQSLYDDKQNKTPQEAKAHAIGAAQIHSCAEKGSMFQGLQFDSKCDSLPSLLFYPPEVHGRAIICELLLHYCEDEGIVEVQRPQSGGAAKGLLKGGKLVQPASRQRHQPRLEADPARLPRSAAFIEAFSKKNQVFDLAYDGKDDVSGDKNKGVQEGYTLRSHSYMTIDDRPFVDFVRLGPALFSFDVQRVVLQCLIGTVHAAAAQASSSGPRLAASAAAAASAGGAVASSAVSAASILPESPPATAVHAFVALLHMLRSIFAVAWMPYPDEEDFVNNDGEHLDIEQVAMMRGIVARDARLHRAAADRILEASVKANDHYYSDLMLEEAVAAVATGHDGDAALDDYNDYGSSSSSSGSRHPGSQASGSQLFRTPDGSSRHNRSWASERNHPMYLPWVFICDNEGKHPPEYSLVTSLMLHSLLAFASGNETCHHATLLFITDGLGWMGPPDTSNYVAISQSLHRKMTGARFQEQAFGFALGASERYRLSLHPHFPGVAWGVLLDHLVCSPTQLASLDRYGLHALRTAMLLHNAATSQWAQFSVEAAETEVFFGAFLRGVVKVDPGKQVDMWKKHTDKFKAIWAAWKADEDRNADSAIGAAPLYMRVAVAYPAFIKFLVEVEYVSAGATSKLHDTVPFCLEQRERDAPIQLLRRHVKGPNDVLFSHSMTENAVWVRDLSAVVGLGTLLSRVLLYSQSEGVWTSAAETLVGLVMASTGGKPDRVKFGRFLMSQIMLLLQRVAPTASSDSAVPPAAAVAAAASPSPTPKPPAKRARGASSAAAASAALVDGGSASTTAAPMLNHGVNLVDLHACASLLTDADIAEMSSAQRFEAVRRLTFLARRLLAEFPESMFNSWAFGNNFANGPDARDVAKMSRVHADEAGADWAAVPVRIAYVQHAKMKATLQTYVANSKASNAAAEVSIVNAQQYGADLSSMLSLPGMAHLEADPVLLPLCSHDTVEAVRKRVAALLRIDSSRLDMDSVATGVWVLPCSQTEEDGDCKRQAIDFMKRNDFIGARGTSMRGLMNNAIGYDPMLPITDTAIVVGQSDHVFVRTADDLPDPWEVRRGHDHEIRLALENVLLSRKLDCGPARAPIDEQVGEWNEQSQWRALAVVDLPATDTVPDAADAAGAGVSANEHGGDGDDVVMISSTSAAGAEAPASAPYRQMPDGLVCGAHPLTPGDKFKDSFVAGHVILDPALMSLHLRVLALRAAASAPAPEAVAIDGARVESWQLLNMQCPTSPLVLALLADPASIDWSAVLDPSRTPTFASTVAAPSSASSLLNYASGAGAGAGAATAADGGDDYDVKVEDVDVRLELTPNQGCTSPLADGDERQQIRVPQEHGLSSGMFYGCTLASVYLLQAAMCYVRPPLEPLVWMADSKGPVQWCREFIQCGGLAVVVKTLLSGSASGGAANGRTAAGDAQPPSLQSLLPRLVRTACLRIVSSLLDPVPAYSLASREEVEARLKAVSSLSGGTNAAGAEACAGEMVEIDDEVGAESGSSSSNDSGTTVFDFDDAGAVVDVVSGPSSPVDAAATAGAAGGGADRSIPELVFASLTNDDQETLVQWLWTQIAGDEDTAASSSSAAAAAAVGGGSESGPASASGAALASSIAASSAAATSIVSGTGTKRGRASAADDESKPAGGRGGRGRNVTSTPPAASATGAIAATAAAAAPEPATPFTLSEHVLRDRISSCVSIASSKSTDRLIRDGIKMLQVLMDRATAGAASTSSSSAGAGAGAGASSVAPHRAPSFERSTGEKQVQAVIRTLMFDPAHVGEAGKTALLGCMEKLLQQSPRLSVVTLKQTCQQLLSLVAVVDPSGQSLESLIPSDAAASSLRARAEGIIDGSVPVTHAVPSPMSIDFGGANFHKLSQLMETAIQAVGSTLTSAPSDGGAAAGASAMNLDGDDSSAGAASASEYLDAIIDAAMRAIAGASLMLKPVNGGAVKFNTTSNRRADGSSASASTPSRTQSLGGAGAGAGAGAASSSDADAGAAMVFPFCAMPEEVTALLERLLHLTVKVVQARLPTVQQSERLVSLLLHHGLFRPSTPLFTFDGRGDTGVRRTAWAILQCVTIPSANNTDGGDDAERSQLMQIAIEHMQSLMAGSDGLPPSAFSSPWLRYLAVPAYSPSSHASLQPFSHALSQPLQDAQRWEDLLLKSVGKPVASIPALARPPTDSAFLLGLFSRLAARIDKLKPLNSIDEDLVPQLLSWKMIELDKFISDREESGKLPLGFGAAIGHAVLSTPNKAIAFITSVLDPNINHSDPAAITAAASTAPPAALPRLTLALADSGLLAAIAERGVLAALFEAPQKKLSPQDKLSPEKQLSFAEKFVLHATATVPRPPQQTKEHVKAETTEFLKSQQWKVVLYYHALNFLRLMVVQLGASVPVRPENSESELTRTICSLSAPILDAWVRIAVVLCIPASYCSSGEQLGPAGAPLPPLATQSTMSIIASYVRAAASASASTSSPAAAFDDTDDTQVTSALLYLLASSDGYTSVDQWIVDVRLFENRGHASHEARLMQVEAMVCYNYFNHDDRASIDSSDHRRSSRDGRFIGLKNQGNTCYMNSLIQQLFMIPAIRHGVLAAPPLSANALALAERDKSYHDPLKRLRHEFQLLFTALTFDNKAVYDPRSFVMACDNVPKGFFPLESNVRQQNDAAEFFALLVDRLGKVFPFPAPAATAVSAAARAGAGAVAASISPTAYTGGGVSKGDDDDDEMLGAAANSIEDSVGQQSTQPVDGAFIDMTLVDEISAPSVSEPTHGVAGAGTSASSHSQPPPPLKLPPDMLAASLGGKLVNQMIGKGECKHSKGRDEDFMFLQLDVEGNDSIEKGLTGYTQGELLAGDNAYMCEKCGKKVDTLKRMCIQTPPDTLLLCLKRFKMNFETFQKEKVNDLFKFGFTLDLYPYTATGIAEAEGGDVGSPAAAATAAAAAASGQVDGGNVEAGSGGAASSSPNDEQQAIPVSVTRGDCQYVLRGVLVHSGSAFGGHYFSYIRPRDGDSNPATGTGLRAMLAQYGSNVEAIQSDPSLAHIAHIINAHNDVGAGLATAAPSVAAASASGAPGGSETERLSEGWLEFNDEYVRPFNASNSEETSRWWFGGNKAGRLCNAFMLFYDRVRNNDNTATSASAAGAAGPDAPAASPASSSAASNTRVSPASSTALVAAKLQPLPVIVPSASAATVMELNGGSMHSIFMTEQISALFLQRAVQYMASSYRKAAAQQAAGLKAAIDSERAGSSSHAQPSLHLDATLSRGPSRLLSLTQATDTLQRMIFGPILKRLMSIVRFTDQKYALVAGLVLAAGDPNRVEAASRWSHAAPSDPPFDLILAGAMPGSSAQASKKAQQARGTTPTGPATPASGSSTAAAASTAHAGMPGTVDEGSSDGITLEVLEMLVRSIVFPGLDIYVDESTGTLVPPTVPAAPASAPAAVDTSNGTRPAKGSGGGKGLMGLPAHLTPATATPTTTAAAAQQQKPPVPPPPAVPLAPGPAALRHLSTVFSITFGTYQEGVYTRSVMSALLPALARMLAVAAEPLLPLYEAAVAATAASASVHAGAAGAASGAAGDPIKKLERLLGLPEPMMSAAYREKRARERWPATAAADSASAPGAPEPPMAPPTAPAAPPPAGENPSGLIGPQLPPGMQQQQQQHLDVGVCAYVPHSPLYGPGDGTDGGLVLPSSPAVGPPAESEAGAFVAASQPSGLAASASIGSDVVLVDDGTDAHAAAPSSSSSAPNGAAAGSASASAPAAKSAALPSSFEVPPFTQPLPEHARAIRALKALDLLVRTMIPFMGMAVHHANNEQFAHYWVCFVSVLQMHPIVPFIFARNHAFEWVLQVLHYAEPKLWARNWQRTKDGSVHSAGPSPLDCLIGKMEYLAQPSPAASSSVLSSLNQMSKIDSFDDTDALVNQILAQTAAESGANGGAGLRTTGMNDHQIQRVYGLLLTLLQCFRFNDLTPAESDGVARKPLFLNKSGSGSGPTSSPFALFPNAPCPTDAFLHPGVREMLLNGRIFYNSLTNPPVHGGGYRFFIALLKRGLQNLCWGNPHISAMWVASIFDRSIELIQTAKTYYNVVDPAVDALVSDSILNTDGYLHVRLSSLLWFPDFRLHPSAVTAAGRASASGIAPRRKLVLNVAGITPMWLQDPKKFVWGHGVPNVPYISRPRQMPDLGPPSLPYESSPSAPIGVTNILRSGAGDGAGDDRGQGINPWLEYALGDDAKKQEIEARFAPMAAAAAAASDAAAAAAAGAQPPSSSSSAAPQPQQRPQAESQPIHRFGLLCWMFDQAVVVTDSMYLHCRKGHLADRNVLEAPPAAYSNYTFKVPALVAINGVSLPISIGPPVIDRFPSTFVHIYRLWKQLGNIPGGRAMMMALPTFLPGMPTVKDALSFVHDRATVLIERYNVTNSEWTSLFDTYKSGLKEMLGDWNATRGYKLAPGVWPHQVLLGGPDSPPPAAPPAPGGDDDDLGGDDSDDGDGHGPKDGNGATRPAGSSGAKRPRDASGGGAGGAGAGGGGKEMKTGSGAKGGPAAASAAGAAVAASGAAAAASSGSVGGAAALITPPTTSATEASWKAMGAARAANVNAAAVPLAGGRVATPIVNPIQQQLQHAASGGLGTKVVGGSPGTALSTALPSLAALVGGDMVAPQQRQLPTGIAHDDDDDVDDDASAAGTTDDASTVLGDSDGAGGSGDYGDADAMMSARGDDFDGAADADEDFADNIAGGFIREPSNNRLATLKHAATVRGKTPVGRNQLAQHAQKLGGKGLMVSVAADGKRAVTGPSAAGAGAAAGSSGGAGAGAPASGVPNRLLMSGMRSTPLSSLLMLLDEVDFSIVEYGGDVPPLPVEIREFSNYQDEHSPFRLIPTAFFDKISKSDVAASDASDETEIFDRLKSEPNTALQALQMTYLLWFFASFLIDLHARDGPLPCQSIPDMVSRAAELAFDEPSEQHPPSLAMLKQGPFSAIAADPLQWPEHMLLPARAIVRKSKGHFAVVPPPAFGKLLTDCISELSKGNFRAAVECASAAHPLDSTMEELSATNTRAINRKPAAGGARTRMRGGQRMNSASSSRNARWTDSDHVPQARSSGFNRASMWSGPNSKRGDDDDADADDEDEVDGGASNGDDGSTRAARRAGPANESRFGYADEDAGEGLDDEDQYLDAPVNPAAGAGSSSAAGDGGGEDDADSNEAEEGGDEVGVESDDEDDEHHAKLSDAAVAVEAQVVKRHRHPHATHEPGLQNKFQRFADDFQYNAEDGPASDSEEFRTAFEAGPVEDGTGSMFNLLKITLEDAARPIKSRLLTYPLYCAAVQKMRHSRYPDAELLPPVREILAQGPPRFSLSATDGFHPVEWIMGDFRSRLETALFGRRDDVFAREIGNRGAAVRDALRKIDKTFDETVKAGGTSPDPRQYCSVALHGLATVLAYSPRLVAECSKLQSYIIEICIGKPWFSDLSIVLCEVQRMLRQIAFRVQDVSANVNSLVSFANAYECETFLAEHLAWLISSVRELARWGPGSWSNVDPSAATIVNNDSDYDFASGDEDDDTEN